MFVAKCQSLSMACDVGDEVEANLSRDCLPVILGNLLANASKYTPEGGQVRMSAHVLGGMLMIQVTDTGVGMDEKTCAQIYSPFFRGADAHASGVAGHGLGLHLVHDLVHRHGGDLGVDSAPGKGTTFTVRLPIKISERALDQADPNERATAVDEIPALLANFHAGTPQSHDSHKTLLIIEDDAEIRTMLVERLSIHYRCIEAADGESALEAARQHLPDLILCDIDLPGMNGYDVCLSLKSSEPTAHIPIVFLTAYAGDSARLQGLRVHGDDYIVKPPSMDELRLKIENRFRTRDALLFRAQNGNLPDVALPDVPTKDQAFVAKALKLKSDIDSAISTHYASADFGVLMLARLLHRSTRTLQRQMEQYGIGMAPLEYLRNYRLGMAAELLRENRKVADVAEACGLDPRTFSDHFKQRYGKTPSEWRKSNHVQNPG
jgi:DNA-binding response OmpR family regulator